jgi:putative transposase
MQYRRARTKGGTYFFTVVTHRRRHILCLPENVPLLREAFRYVMSRHPFTIDAFVLLPDHLHRVWTLPEGDGDFSTRWQLIKGTFTRGCDAVYRGCASPSRERKGEQGVWQRRFWEHQNASFHRYVRAGVYAEVWGAGGEMLFEPGIGSE